MKRLLVLHGNEALLPGPSSGPAELLSDPETLFKRLRDDEGDAPWVAITPDFVNRAEIAAQLQRLEPAASVILLGGDGPSGDALISAASDLEDGLKGLDAYRRRSAEAEKPASDQPASIPAFVSAVIHDIGTPMTSILGYAQLIAQSADGDKNQKRARAIVDQVHRVRDLIETLFKPAGD